VKNGETLPEGMNHPKEAQDTVNMLDKAIRTLSLARRSRNAAAQQRIDSAIEKARRIRQQISDILKPLQQ